jgi:fructokinase
MRVTVVGEAVLDRVRTADGQITEVPGGSPANVALGLTRAGVEASLRARFSLDRSGRLLRQHLLTEGVNLSASIDTDDPALIVDADISATGSPTYTFHLEGAADFRWTAGELDPVVPHGTRFLHTGSLAATMPPGAEVIRDWAMSTGIPISYDVNVRPGVWTGDSDRLQTAEHVAAWVQAATVVKASDEDIENLMPQTSWHDWAVLISHGRVVIITCGSDGAYVLREGQTVAHVRPQPVQVVDTVGAGDTFMAWLLRSLAEAPDALTLDATALTEATRTAVTAAAITCTRRGCDPPTLHEMQMRSELDPDRR